MTTIPPAHAIRQRIANWLVNEKPQLILPELSREQGAVADWLRGDTSRLESLLNLFRARIEGRGTLPIPSNPNDAMIRTAMDAEARSIMAELRLLHNAPVGSEENV